MAPDTQAIHELATIVSIFTEYAGIALFVFSVIYMIKGYASGEPTKIATADKQFKFAILCLLISAASVTLAESVYKITDEMFENIGAIEVNSTEFIDPSVAAEVPPLDISKDIPNGTPLLRENYLLKPVPDLPLGPFTSPLGNPIPDARPK